MLPELRDRQQTVAASLQAGAGRRPDKLLIVVSIHRHSGGKTHPTRVAGEETSSSHLPDDARAFRTRLLGQVPVSNHITMPLSCPVLSTRIFTRFWKAQLVSISVVILLRQSDLKVLTCFRTLFHPWSTARVHGAPSLPSARKCCSQRKRRGGREYVLPAPEDIR